MFASPHRVASIKITNRPPKPFAGINCLVAVRGRIPNSHMKSNQNNSIHVSRGVDRIGSALASLCIIHCALIPIIGVFLPVIENEATDALVHLAFLAMALPITSVAILKSVRSGNRLASLFLLIGLIVISAVQLEPALHHLESMLSIIGGALLLVGHSLNCGCNARSCPVTVSPVNGIGATSSTQASSPRTGFFDQAPA